MNLILFDAPDLRTQLLPFTFTRPVGNLRVGILTIGEKWGKRLGLEPSFLTEPYLQEKFPLRRGGDNLLVNGAVCPDDALLKAVTRLQPGERLMQGQTLLAARHGEPSLPDLSGGKQLDYAAPTVVVDRVWKIWQYNAEQVKLDIALLTSGRQSAGIQDPHTRVYGAENIFVEEGAQVRAAIINAERGPVYLGPGTVVHEGAMIRGTFALCEGAEINMGAKIRGDTTVGPYCKVGGEVAAAVVYAHSNKSHDGYLGCSVVGEWCNIGADSNTSNLKNNYETIKLWSHGEASFRDTGLQFCGLMMGDHSKCGINSMFNTGTVVDVFANVFGEGYLRNYIPSFSWGGSSKITTYQLDKALEVARRVMERRNLPLGEVDRRLLTTVFNITAAHRPWESNT